MRIEGPPTGEVVSATPIRSASSTNRVGLLLSIGSGLTFSVATVSAAKALSDGTSVAVVGALRLLVACSCLWLVRVATRGRGGPARSLPGRLRATLLLIGLLNAAQVALLYKSVDELSPALAILLLYAYPTIVAILAVVFLKERLTRTKVVAVTLTVGGSALIVGSPAGHVSVVGVLCGCAAALSLALYIILAARLRSATTSLIQASWQQAGACVGFLPVLLTGASSGGGSGLAWAMLVGVASGSAAVMFLGAIKRLTPITASTVSSIEPVSTAGLSALLVDERYSGIQLAGGVLVVASVLIVARTVGRTPTHFRRARRDEPGVMIGSEWPATRARR
jgi:drug/metabolite transporter (DMT)-like permease